MAEKPPMNTAIKVCHKKQMALLPPEKALYTAAKIGIISGAKLPLLLTLPFIQQ